MKTYVLMVEIDEGNDEWWEDVAKGQSRQKVRDGIRSCLADQGFIAPWCRVKVTEVRKCQNQKRR